MESAARLDAAIVQGVAAVVKLERQEKSPLREWAGRAAKMLFYLLRQPAHGLGRSTVGKSHAIGDDGDLRRATPSYGAGG